MPRAETKLGVCVWGGVRGSRSKRAQRKEPNISITSSWLPLDTVSPSN